ncbi:hypothetical protein JQ634_26820 [Bradyrhizobium sp. AUGA SZCCT0240]|jgi:hypothetical protein|uniref:hypothetical protein n=1 Tax=unclassified Bradyrhizobium TaxID=2631580 RepID=UPI001BA95C7F|nr:MULTISPECIES: hypothetical protein [unclassified Bradyrhizobium]MBR1200613.1 hypothetical protein [Bradyrhizobium sp. AUGA SZCCT0158]MBR1257289.1 hypothetical protein [Bradyrhizobium sp. AUGA SZCCT0240]
MADRAHAAGIPNLWHAQDLAAAHNQIFQNFIPFERFQIALPLIPIGIILRAD